MDKALPGLRKLIPLSLLPLIAARADAAAPLLYLDAPLEEYPVQARAEKLEGNVRVHLHVSPNGALRCSAEEGGRLGALRRPSCVLIAKRDIFAPFTDAKGEPLETDIDVVVRWKVAPTNRQYGGAIAISPDRWLTNDDVYKTVAPSGPWGSVKLSFTVTTMGTTANCKVMESSKSLAIDAAACPTFMKRAMFLPALDANGTPVPVEASAVQNWWTTIDRPN